MQLRTIHFEQVDPDGPVTPADVTVTMFNRYWEDGIDDYIREAADR